MVRRGPEPWHASGDGGGERLMQNPLWHDEVVEGKKVWEHSKSTETAWTEKKGHRLFLKGKGGATEVHRACTKTKNQACGRDLQTEGAPLNTRLSREIGRISTA